MRSPSSRPRKARHSRNRHSPARSSGGGRRGEQIPTVPAEERPQSNLGGVAGAAPKIHSAMVQQPRAGIDSAEMDHNAAGGCSSAQAAGQTAAHTEATTQKHAAALSALKAEHARAIEQLQSEAEMQASTARRRYGDQVAELEAELGVARAAAEAASGSGAKAAVAMMSKMESATRAVAAKDAQLEAAAQAQHALREQKELLAVQHAHSLAARDRDIMVSTTVAPLRSTDENAPRSTDRNAPLRPLRNSGAEERAGRGPAAGGGSHAAARRVVVTARRGGQARGSRNGSSQGRTAARE
jgi:hypothetical protein